MMQKDRFSLSYETEVSPIIERIISDEILLPVKYTISNGRNRFRSGLTCEIGAILQTNNAPLLGAIGEIIWACALIIDDIGDQTRLRRGEQAAWVKFGLLWASHASCIGIIKCYNILKNENVLESIVNNLIQSIMISCEGQIQQKQLTFNNDEQEILNTYQKKMQIGIWPLLSTIESANVLSESKRKVLYDMVRVISFKLGIIGQITNDLQDLLAYNQNFEAVLSDINGKIVTYPIYLLYKLDPKSYFSILNNNVGEKLNPTELGNFLIEMFACNNGIVSRIENTVNTLFNEVNILCRDLEPPEMKEIIGFWSNTYLTRYRDISINIDHSHSQV